MDYGFIRSASETGIKQFLVTNTNKEQPGSIVTKTLKNGILLPIVTSKESYFYADFKCKISSSLVLHIKSYEPEKICRFYKIGGKTPKSHKILT